MALRVFSQNPLDLARLVSAGTTHFSIDLEVLRAEGERRVELRVQKQALFSGSFAVTTRPVSPSDLEDAERAEERGRAAGMASLARRCATVWEVSPLQTAQRPDEAALDDPALLGLCAVLATVALGPVLPADGSTLLGVRSSVERLEKALAQRPS